jgi:hypothetical protein
MVLPVFFAMRQLIKATRMVVFFLFHSLQKFDTSPSRAARTWEGERMAASKAVAEEAAWHKPRAGRGLNFRQRKNN